MLEGVELKVFKETKGRSYSKLSKLATSPQAYRANLVEDSESPAIALGAAVDLMLTDPDKLKDEIYVMSANPPKSDMMQSYCEAIAAGDDTVKAYTNSGFSISHERVAGKWLEDGKEYTDALVKSKDKKILGIGDMMKANQIVTTLKANEFTQEYFTPENEDIELKFQVPLIWSMEYRSLVDDQLRTAVMKSVLDVIKINHKTLEVTPIELKTGAEGFFKSFWKWKRYLQAGMYNDAVDFHMSNMRDYKLNNIKFVYADTNMVKPPAIYNMTDLDLQMARDGRRYYDVHGSITNSWKIKGYKQLVRELEWHEKNDLWDYPYDVYQKYGEIDIDAFLVKL